MITVLVTGAGGGVGQGIIKSLMMIDGMDISIISADMSELAAGLYASDIACLVEGCNSPGYMDSLKLIFDKYNVDFYIPGTDVELRFCAENRDTIKEKFSVETVVSSIETIDISDDKFKTYEFLKSEGFSYPKTLYLSDFSLFDLDFPVIVKPAIGCRSIGVYKIDTSQELEKYLDAPDGLIVQEYVGNENMEYTCTVVKTGAHVSPILALKRELRSGDTYRAVPIKSDVIEDYIHQLAGKLNIEGGCNFQLRLDTNGIPKLFEINSRFSGTTPFCAQLGFNPLEYYLMKKVGYDVDVDIDYDSYVLRYWSEVVVKQDQMTSLSREHCLIPVFDKQFRLFD